MLDNNASLKELIDAFQMVDSDLIDRGGAQTITPSSSNRILPRGNYRGDITVKGDSNLVSQNIKEGVNIFGVTGKVQEGVRLTPGNRENSNILMPFKSIGYNYIKLSSYWSNSLGGYTFALSFEIVVSTYENNHYFCEFPASGTVSVIIEERYCSRPSFQLYSKSGTLKMSNNNRGNQTFNMNVEVGDTLKIVLGTNTNESNRFYIVGLYYK